MEVEEDTKQHQEDNERCSGDRLDTRFTHDTNGDSTQHEGGQNQHHSEDQSSEWRKATNGEDDDHGEEGDTHEDGNVLEWPFVPSFAFHVFLATVALERCTDVREDVGKGAPHLCQSEHTTADDGTDSDGTNRLSKGDHLQRSRATTGIILDGDVGLLRCIVDRDVHEHSQRDEEEPTHDGTEVDQKRHTGFHEPADGKHRRRQRHPNVGVGKWIPCRFF